VALLPIKYATISPHHHHSDLQLFLSIPFYRLSVAFRWHFSLSLFGVLIKSFPALSLLDGSA
jgi:hypothetical protein